MTPRVSAEVARGGETVLKESFKSLCFQKFPPLIGSHSRCLPLCVSQPRLRWRLFLFRLGLHQLGAPRARSAAR